MRRLIHSTLAATFLIAASSGIALGAKPTNSCPSETSGYFLVDVDGWWDVTVDGFEAEGIPVYESDGVTYTDAFNEFAVGFGLADGAELEAFVRGPQWESIDRNGNGWGCMKARPTTPGNGTPAFLFNGMDERSASKG